MISIQYLNYFMKICQTRSMNKAAEELFISQPALSQAMRNLEKELNVTLFVRSNKGIELTAKGEEILKHARLIMNQFALLENLHEEQTYNQLSVSAFPCLIPSEVLISYKKNSKYGKSYIDYQECRVGQIIENVHNSVSEIGVLQYNNYQLSVLTKKLKKLNLELHKLCQKQWAIVVGKKSPLYNNEFVTLQDLKKYRLIRQKDDYFSYLTGEIRAAETSMDDLPCDWIDSGVMISALLEKTDMYMFACMQKHFMNSTSKVRLIPIANSSVDIYIGWIQKRNTVLSEEAEAFIHILEKEFS